MICIYKDENDEFQIDREFGSYLTIKQAIKDISQMGWEAMGTNLKSEVLSIVDEDDEIVATGMFVKPRSSEQPDEQQPDLLWTYQNGKQYRAIYEVWNEGRYCLSCGQDIRHSEAWPDGVPWFCLSCWEKMTKHRYMPIDPEFQDMEDPIKLEVKNRYNQYYEDYKLRRES